MRKSIFIFLLINIITINVYASTTVVDYVEITEEVINYNSNNIDILIKIPETCNEETISINTKVLDSINHFRLLNNKNKSIKVNLIIDNYSKYTYKYNNDSIKLFITNHNIKSYRTKNTALKKLFNNKRVKLDDKSINKRLNSLGYNSLDEYYLYFYNNKYKTKYNNLNSLNKDIKKEIFKYSNNYIEETNEEINNMAKDYYNEELIRLIFNNRKYSINDCLNYYIDDSEFKQSLYSIYDKGVVSFYIELDNNYNDNFSNYLKGSIYFTLNKISNK